MVKDWEFKHSGTGEGARVMTEIEWEVDLQRQGGQGTQRPHIGPVPYVR